MDAERQLTPGFGGRGNPIRSLILYTYTRTHSRSPTWMLRIGNLAAQPAHERCKFPAVRLSYRCEFEPQTSARHDVPDDGVRTNRPFSNKKIDFRRCADRPQCRGLQK